MYVHFLWLGLILLGLHSTLSAQQWIHAIGDTTGPTYITSMHLQQENAMLLSGGFSAGKLPLGSSELNSNGGMDAYAAAVDAAGNFLWAKNFGGEGYDLATAVITDASGNIYVGGSFSSLSITIGDTTLLNQGESDGFVVKMHPDLSIAWVLSVATAYKDEIVGLAVDGNGNLYIGGHSINNLSSNAEVAFIIQANTNSTIQWIRKAVVNSGSITATSIALNSNGRCFLAGGFSGNLKPDGGTAFNSSSYSSGFILSYNANGDYQQGMAVSNLGKVNALKTFGSEVLICGEQVNYGFGWGWPLSDSKIYVHKYQQNLSKLWEKNAGGTVPMQSLDIARSLATDPDGNVYVTGSFFGPKLGFAGDSLPNIFNKDYFYQQIFVLKYDNNGNEIWGKSFGGSLSESGDALLALDNDRWLLAGQFESDTLDLGGNILLNKGRVMEYYVHLKPRRLGRNPISFLSLFKETSTGIRSDLHQASIQLYPQPAEDEVTIHFENQISSNISVSIYSADGRLIDQQESTVADHSIKIMTRTLLSGMYILLLETPQSSTAVKMLKK